MFMKIIQSTSISLMCASLLGVACSKKDASEVANNLKEEPKLNGTFAGKCAKNNLLGLTSQTKLKFTGNKFSKEEIFFQQADCSGSPEGSSLVLNGTFEVKSGNLPTNGAGTIKLELNEAYIMPKTDFVAKAANLVKFCGYDSYVVGQKADITNSTDKLLCPVEKVPNVLFGAYNLIEGKSLYLNTGDISKMSAKEVDGPTDLDMSVVYQRQ